MLNENQKETAVVVATVATIALAALVVGKTAGAVTRIRMPRKFNRMVDLNAAANQK